MEVAASTAILDFRLIRAFDGSIWTDVIRLSLPAHWKPRRSSIYVLFTPYLTSSMGTFFLECTPWTNRPEAGRVIHLPN
jgi:hypothetical protein